MEKWKDIEGYEGRYQISNLGKAKSLNYGRTGKAQVLKTLIDSGGYSYVVLFKKAKRKTNRISRLVAQAFIDNPENKLFVNHLDGNKHNNCVKNLEWCTQSENEKHAHKIGLKNHKGEKHPGSKLKDIEVKVIKKLIKTSLKISEIAHIFKVTPSLITLIKKNKTRSHL